MTEHDEHEHELVMPFVVVASTGGPFDDAAYVAGWQAAAIDTQLAALARSVVPGPLTPSWSASVYTANLPQLDLIAMRNGFEVQTEYVLGRDEWTAATFTYTPQGE